MRILLVEDEPSAARFIAKGLREAAYAVDVAADGVTAAEQCQQNEDIRLHRIDVMIVLFVFSHGFVFVCLSIR